MMLFPLEKASLCGFLHIFIWYKIIRVATYCCRQKRAKYYVPKQKTAFVERYNYFYSLPESFSLGGGNRPEMKKIGAMHHASRLFFFITHYFFAIILLL